MTDLKKVGNLGQICFVRESQLTEGAGRGNRILDVNNGRLRFTLLKDNCLDIADLSYGGKNYSFIGKPGLTDGSFGGSTSLNDNFGGGMLYTCGLDCTGIEEGKRAHGAIHWTAAVNVCVICNQNLIEISGEMHSAALFKQNLIMRRTVSTKVMSGEVTVRDELENIGYGTENYKLMYHVNFGWPLLDSSTKIKGDFFATEPIDEWSKSQQNEIYNMEAPSDRKFETVYFQSPKIGDFTVYNEAEGMSARLQYDTCQLPVLLEWKSMASGDYALGLEPAVTRHGKNGKHAVIESGEVKTFEIKLTFN